MSKTHKRQNNKRHNNIRIKLRKTMKRIFSGIIGLFIGIHRKIISSSMIFIFIFLGSLFSKGNGKIYTVILGFIIGLYISKQISKIFNKKYKNRFIKFIF